MAPKPEFRENPKRCIYVTGEINQQLVDRLTPQIIELRFASQLPITVYIDSVGGSTRHAKLLLNLLRSPTQDNPSCSVVTVATGLAGSSAADLLVLGNYAIAYPHATIWFHGTRQLAGQPVTTEVASTLAESLRQSNEGFAFELAYASWRRFFLRYVTLRPDFGSMKKDFGQASWADVDCLAYGIALKVATAEFQVPLTAIRKHGRLGKLSDYLLKKGQQEKDLTQDEAQVQAKLLKWLIDFNLREKRKDKNWLFSKTGFAELQQDFALFLDYHTGEHMRNLRDQVKSWGPLCLDDEEKSEYEKLSEAQKEQWIVTHKEETVKSLWQLLVSICRSLQQGEHNVPATDAYWLGLIDEVVGTSLPNLRIILESQIPTGEKPDTPSGKSEEVTPPVAVA